MRYSTASLVGESAVNVTSLDLEPRTRTSHRAAFFKSWLLDPIGVASIAPSGRVLARLMAADIGPDARVIELGAGTGTLTQALIDNGVAPERLYLVEQHPDFVRILKERFADANVLQIDAAEIGTQLAHAAGDIDFVVSGLPIVWFGRERKRRILGDAFDLLAPGGRFHQFTYLGRPPVGAGLLDSLGIRARLAGFAPLNMPPAFVYHFERAA